MTSLPASNWIVTVTVQNSHVTFCLGAIGGRKQWGRMRHRKIFWLTIHNTWEASLGQLRHLLASFLLVIGEIHIFLLSKSRLQWKVFSSSYIPLRRDTFKEIFQVFLLLISFMRRATNRCKYFETTSAVFTFIYALISWREILRGLVARPVIECLFSFRWIHNTRRCQQCNRWQEKDKPKTKRARNYRRSCCGKSGKLETQTWRCVRLLPCRNGLRANDWVEWDAYTTGKKRRIHYHFSVRHSGFSHTHTDTHIHTHTHYTCLRLASRFIAVRPVESCCLKRAKI